MTRAKYTKPPCLPSVAKIQPTKFRFRHDQRGELRKLLPRELASLLENNDAVTRPANGRTIADAIVQKTEYFINIYFTGNKLLSDGQFSPARVRAAIRRLRESLKPFTMGLVDDETADILPPDLDAKLAARDQAIAKLRLPPIRQRALGILCQYIAVSVKQSVSTAGRRVTEQDLLRFVDGALNAARIKHPDISKHRDRLARLCFPPDAVPQ